MVVITIIFIVFVFAFTSFVPLIVEGKEPGMFIIHPKR